MAQCVIDPQSSLVLLLARRVNSAAGERGLRRSAMRNYSAPVVTACSIDPTTHRLGTGAFLPALGVKLQY